MQVCIEHVRPTFVGPLPCFFPAACHGMQLNYAPSASLCCLHTNRLPCLPSAPRFSQLCPHQRGAVPLPPPVLAAVLLHAQCRALLPPSRWVHLSNTSRPLAAWLASFYRFPLGIINLGPGIGLDTPCVLTPHTCAHTYIHMNIHTHMHMHMRTHTLTRTHVHIHAHTRTYTHAHANTHMHTHTHTQTHTHTNVNTHMHCVMMAVSAACGIPTSY